MSSYTRVVRKVKQLWPVLQTVEFEFLPGKGATRYEYGLCNGVVAVTRVTLLIPEGYTTREVAHELSKEVAKLLGKESWVVESELCAA